MSKKIVELANEEGCGIKMKDLNGIARFAGIRPAAHKLHCSNLAADGLKLAIENYRRKLLGLPPNSGVTLGGRDL